MSAPSCRERAELVALQVALARGWLQEQDLREAVSLRARLIREGDERGLLELVSHSYLQPEQAPQLEAIYTMALQAAALQVAASHGTGVPDPRARTRAGGSDVGRVDDEAPTRGPQPSSGPPAVAGTHVGRYELRGELGRGGMGTVYRAWDPELRREVALKLLSPASLDDERERFRREARAAAALRHPHAVRVLDVGVSEPPWLAMELIEGESLKARLQREGPWPPRAAALLARKLASALGAAHALGLVHRDVKPANVLLDHHGEPLLTDFGLARRLDGSEQRLTRSGDVMGTPTYMSPEQARGERDVGRTSDVWSLGALLYHLLTGRPPFLEASVMEQIKALLQRAPEPPSRLCPDLPARLEAIVLRCLERDPARRYPDARALEADLAAWLAEETAPRAAAQAPAEGTARAPLLAGLIVAGGALGALLTLTLAAPAPVTPPSPASTDAPPVALDPAQLRAEAERLHARGATDQAIAALGSALLLAPRDQDSLIRRAELRLAAADPRGAAADAGLALELDPLALRARRLRGRARLACGQPEPACADLEQAWDLARGGPFADDVRRELIEALLAAGADELAQGQLEPLLRRLDRVDALEPEWPPACQLRAEALLRDDQPARAEALAERGLRDPERLRASGLDPGWLLWVRAQARYEQRQVEPALADFDRALATLPPGPRTGVIHLLRGQARLLGARDPAGALDDVARADALLPADDPNRPLVERLRALARERQEAR